MEIKVMARQGYSIRQMARVSGLSRQTVRRSLLQPDAQAPSYPQRPTRPSVLDPFKPYIAQRIEQAQPDRILGSVLLREIREQGYPGGRSILHTCLHANRPAAAVDPLARFETAPREFQICK